MSQIHNNSLPADKLHAFCAAGGTMSIVPMEGQEGVLTPTFGAIGTWKNGVTFVVCDSRGHNKTGSVETMSMFILRNSGCRQVNVLTAKEKIKIVSVDFEKFDLDN